MTPELLATRLAAERADMHRRIATGMARERVNPKRRAKKADGLSPRQRKRLKSAALRAMRALNRDLKRPEIVELIRTTATA